MSVMGTNHDPLYQEAKETVISFGYASVSRLQRAMRIGYTRAAMLIDTMVADGFLEKKPDITGKRKIIAPNTASTGQVTPAPSNQAETSESLSPSK